MIILVGYDDCPIFILVLRMMAAEKYFVRTVAGTPD